MNFEKYTHQPASQMPNLMIEQTQEFVSRFRQLYNESKAELHFSISFENIMNSNLDRINFINILFEYIEFGKLSDGFSQHFNDNIEYLKNFIIGSNQKVTIPISHMYIRNSKKSQKNKYYIVPTNEDLLVLFELIKINYELFNKYYEDNIMLLKMPAGTLNQNMFKAFEIEKYNLGHLLGLTETGGNELTNFFVQIDQEQNPDLYDENGYLKEGYVAERLLNWVISDEGQKIILESNQVLLNFIKEDKKKNKGAYDEYGNIKDIDKFITRYESYLKNSDKNIIRKRKYPILNFSRLYVKAINTLNFLGMNNVTTMISDYNKPNPQELNKKGPAKKEPITDIYLISSSQNELEELIKDYESKKTYYYELIKKYALSKNRSEKDKIKEFLISKGMKWKDNEHIILEYEDLLNTRFYIGDKAFHNINTTINKIINQMLEEQYLYIFSLFGFRSYFDKEETSSDELNVSISKCVSSISLNALEMSDDYYKNGRCFFVDSLFMPSSPSGQSNSYFRISNVEEEISFLKSLDPINKENQEKIARLQNAKEVLLTNFINYKNNMGRQRKK